MVFNPLFIQKNTSKENALFAKAGSLKGKGYLFSDMMQVVLNGEQQAGKANQMINFGQQIDADETNGNLLKLSEGLVSTDKDIKFKNLLKLLGVTSESVPEKSGMVVEVPEISTEELESLLKQLVSNTENEDELDKVIEEKIKNHPALDDKNFLVTIQYDQKTITLDLIPAVELSVSNSANPEQGTQLNTSVDGKVKNFSMTVSVLPSNISETIMAKFISASQQVKKEAEGSSIQTNLEGKEVKVYEQQNVSELSSEIEQQVISTEDKAKKVTIYSVLKNQTEILAENNNTMPNQSLGEQLKKIKLNNNSASLKSNSTIDIGSQTHSTAKIKPDVVSQTNTTTEIMPDVVPQSEMKKGEVISELNSPIPVKENKNTDFQIKEPVPLNKIPKPGNSLTNLQSDSKLNDANPIQQSEKQIANDKLSSSDLLKNLIAGATEKKSNSNDVASLDGNVNKADPNLNKAALKGVTIESVVSKTNNTKNLVGEKQISNDVASLGENVNKANSNLTKAALKGVTIESVASKPNNAKNLVAEKLISAEPDKAKHDETAEVIKVVNNELLQSGPIKISKKPRPVVTQANVNEPKVDSQNDENNDSKIIKGANDPKLETTQAQMPKVENKQVANQEVNLPKPDNIKGKSVIKDSEVKIKSEKEEAENIKVVDSSVKANQQSKPSENTAIKVDNKKESLAENSLKNNEKIEVTKNESAQDKSMDSNSFKNHLSDASINNAHSLHGVKQNFDEVLNLHKTERIVQHKDLVKELHHFIEKKEGTQLVLKVEPADLGKVKITLDMTQHIMKANIEVESEAIRQTLERSMQDLQNQLNKSGIQLGSVNISLQDAEGKNKQNHQTKKKNSQNRNGGGAIENEPGETHSGKTMGYNTYDYVV